MSIQFTSGIQASVGKFCMLEKVEREGRVERVGEEEEGSLTTQVNTPREGRRREAMAFIRGGVEMKEGDGLLYPNQPLLENAGYVSITRITRIAIAAYSVVHPGLRSGGILLAHFWAHF